MKTVYFINEKNEVESGELQNSEFGRTSNHIKVTKDVFTVGRLYDTYEQAQIRAIQNKIEKLEKRKWWTF